MQEAFLKLWLWAPKWDPEGIATVRTWLSRVVTNLSLDVCRRRQIVVSDEIDDLVDETDGAFEQMRAQEKKRVIQTLLELLPHRQRAAIVHYYFEELSGRDVSLVMDISEGAAESLLVRARRQLRAQIKQLGLVWGEDL